MSRYGSSNYSSEMNIPLTPGKMIFDLIISQLDDLLRDECYFHLPDYNYYHPIVVNVLGVSYENF